MDCPIPTPFELETERLWIRSPAPDHAAALTEAITESIDRLKPWMPWAQEAPTVEAMTENCTQAEADFRAGTDNRMHVFAKDDGSLIGCTGFHRSVWTVPKVEIGYWVRTGREGRGYVTEMVRAIVDYAFEELDANRVEIRMSARNARSRRVVDRLGFELEGTLRNEAREVDGRLCDTLVFAMLGEGDSA